MPLQFRRGTDSDRSTITPDLGEPLFTTNTKRLFIGDGTTAGGLRIGLDSGEVLSIVNDNSVDSALVENLIDSAYVQNKQDYSYGSLTGTPTALTEFTNDLTITTDSVGEGSTNLYYTDTRVSTLVDSAYINLRTDANLDSDLTIQLIDSSYVQARQATTDLTDYRTVTQIQSMIDSEVTSLVDAAPGALDTLNELAAALGDDANFSTTITNQIAALPDSAQVATIVTSYGYATTGYVDDAAAALPDSAQVATIVTSYGYATEGYVDDAVATLPDSAQVATIVTSYGYATEGYVDNAIAALPDSAQVATIVTSYGYATEGYVDAAVDALPDSAQVATIVTSYGYATTGYVDDAVAALPDSAQVATIVTSYGYTTYDSSNTIGLVDSAYVQSRQDFAYSSLTGAPNVLDSADVTAVAAEAGYYSSGDTAAFASVTTTGNIIVGGNLQVTGTTTTVNSQSLEVTDNMIYLNAGESSGSPTANIDIGFAGNVNDDGAYTHVGFFRDADDNTWKVFNNYTPEPDSGVTINTGHSSFELAPFMASTLTGKYLGFESDASLYNIAYRSYVDEQVAALPDSAQVATIVTSYGYSTYDSSNTLGIVDSAYINARVETGTDSATVVSIIESYGYSTYDSNDTLSLIDSAYINARVDAVASGTDSATVVSIAAAPVAYIAETVYTVTVGSKSSTHPYYNVGSPNGYIIDGVDAPFIEMVPGQTYKFDLSDASVSGHPLRFYTDVDKTTQYTSGVTQSGTEGSANAYVSIAVDDDTPSRLYYQCSFHSNMGWAVGTHTHNLTNFDTDDLSEGSTNLYYTDTRAQGAFSAGTGITINSGTISIGQNVATTSNVTFNNLLLNGDLTVQGTTTTVNTETINLADNIILLNSNEQNAPTENGGVEIERGTLDNVQLRWNETDDEWQLGVLDSNLDTPTYYRIFTEADSARLTSNLDATTLNGQAASYYTNYNNITNTPTSILDFNITDGNAGQALITDGSGNFTFSTISGGSGGGATGATTTARHQNVSTGGAAYGTAGGTYTDVLVYVNGILARDSDDYSFNDSSGIVTFTTAPETGSEIDIIGIKSNILDIDSSDNVTFNGDIKVGNHSNYSSGKTTGSTIVETTIDTFDATTVRGAKYVITAENDSDRYQISEALVIHDGVTATITTYGTINTGTGNLCVFDANYDSVSNVVELNATPTTINTVYKVVRTDVVI